MWEGDIEGFKSKYIFRQLSTQQNSSGRVSITDFKKLQYPYVGSALSWEKTWKIKNKPSGSYSSEIFVMTK